MYMNLLELITTYTQSRPTYCVFTYLPCWVVPLSSDSPSICLSRLMNGRKNICFPWRWWPTAATQREVENECFNDWTSCITMTEKKWNRIFFFSFQLKFINTTLSLTAKKLINNKHTYTIVDMKRLKMTWQCWRMTEWCEWTETERDDCLAGWVITGWLKNAQWDTDRERKEQEKKETEWCNERDNKD